MFAGGRRNGFLLAIAISCMLSLYLNKTNAIDSKKKKKKKRGILFAVRENTPTGHGQFLNFLVSKQDV